LDNQIEVIPAGSSELVTGVVNNALNKVILKEGDKGCSPLIWEHPVCLEPPFELFSLKNFLRHTPNDCVSKAYKFERDISNLEVLKIWPDPEDKFSWQLFEDMIKEFSVIPRMISFEICGNSKEIGMFFTAEKQDIAIIKNIVQTKFPEVFLEQKEDILKSYSGNIEIVEFYPPPPYWKNLSSYGSFVSFPLDIIYVVWSQLSEKELGIFQVLFTPASKDSRWHVNVSELIDLEYRIRHESSGAIARPYFNQTPSTYLPGVAKEEETKAADKPFLFATVRMGVFSKDGERAENILKSAAAFSGNLRYGSDNSLNILKTGDYVRVLKDKQVLVDMFRKRHSFRQGMLLNSKEMVSFVSFASKDILENKRYNIARVEGFEVPVEIAVEDNGSVKIGTNMYAGKKMPVYIPGHARPLTTSIIGRPGQGKSRTLEEMIIADIKAGRGVSVMDPHGDLIDNILPFIPKHRIKDVIYLDFGDREYIPKFNLFIVRDKKNISKLAGNLTCAFKGFIDSWGLRMQGIFQHMFFSLLSVQGMTLSDGSLLISKTPEGERLRRIIIPLLKNTEAERFWTDDFPTYSMKEIDPVRNKISPILEDELLYKMFSVRHTDIDYRWIMDKNKIVLHKLSVGIIGTNNANALGSLIAPSLYYAAMGRANIKEKERNYYYFYVDEIGRFNTEFFSNIIEEGRKYSLCLTAALQRKSQVSKDLVGALSGAGTIIAFSLGPDDAKEIFKSFRKEVNEKDIIGLAKYNAFASINSNIVSLTTIPPEFPKNDFSKEIIENSRKQYCIKASDFKPMDVFSFLESKKDTKVQIINTVQPQKRYFDEF